jgi:GNAT superfamily N-acetyltransferase
MTNQLASIRPAESGDIDSLVALSKRTIRARYISFLGEKPVEDYLASGAVENYFQESLPRCFVVEEMGAVAGVAAYKDLAVDLMMVDAERQGRGLGTRLLAHLETLLFSKSDELTLESFAENEQANAFYRKRGWVVIENYKDKETGIPMVRLRKRKS